ncbi:MAG: thermonuclease family protein [Pseudomonadota bacterium]
MLIAFLMCSVVGISDGDTLKVKCATDRGHQSLTVRLAEIDAPEKGQPFGQRSKQHLSDLCLRRNAEVRTTSRDRYGRTVARVVCDGTDANATMVRDGMAWAYTRYLTDPQIRGMEVLAQRERVGIWSDGTAIAPWHWRANAKRT